MSNNAAIWARVSTNDQDVENQIAQLEIWAEKKGFDVVRIYRVEESAYRRVPLAAEDVIKAGHRGEFGTLLIWALDRLSRSGIGPTLALMERMAGAGVNVLSHEEEFTAALSSPEIRELMVSLTAWIAKWESARLSERTKAGIERARKDGQQIGRPKGSRDKKRRQNRGYLLRYS